MPVSASLVGSSRAPLPGDWWIVATTTFNLGPALIGLAAAAIALLGAWWLAGRFLRPLRAITSTAQEISATNLNRRLDLRGPKDELSDLGSTLNDLFARLETSFESQRHFVANAGHELRTPLAGQRTLLQVALADRTPTRKAEINLRGSARAQQPAGATHRRPADAGYQRTRHRDLGQLDLAQITQTVVTGRKHDADAKDIQIRTSLAAAPAAGDPQLVELLIANLIDNALEHNHHGGHVEISTATSQGRAILSLAIVSAIATAHAAHLSARPRTDGGLNLEVSFPSTQSSIGSATSR